MRAAYCGAPPAFASTFEILSISRSISAANSADVVGAGSMPMLRMRSATSGSFSAATTAAFSLAMTCGGVAAGATRPNQPLVS